jgi:anti-anti-sigma factor
MGGHFSFVTHHEFTSTYLQLLSDSIINTVAVDLANVERLDSAALGMLLILRERIRESGKSLLLLRPSPIVASAFAITHFHRLFTIQSTV